MTSEGKLQYMFALLIQRTLYLVSTQSSIIMPADEQARSLALATAHYMQTAGNIDFLFGIRSGNRSLKKEGRRLLTEAEKDFLSHKSGKSGAL